MFDGKDKTQELYRYLNNISAELWAVNRRPIMWGDQLLYKSDKFPEECITYGESKEITEELIKNLDKNIIIADWQYYVKNKDIPTSQFLTASGFEIILAPFDCEQAIKICADDTVTHNYYGFMQTSWDLMHGKDFRLVLRGATYAWEGVTELTKEDNEFIGFKTCSYQRKLLPVKGIYRNCGIREKQIET